MASKKALVNKNNQMDQSIQVIGYKENEMEKEKQKFHNNAITKVVSQWE